jgi:hypothetical protein
MEIIKNKFYFKGFFPPNYKLNKYCHGIIII